MFVWKACLVLLSFVLGLANAEGEKYSHSHLDKCPKFQIKKSTIIKTQQSIRNGAEFLGKKIMTSSRGCHESCCETDNCNLVMLKYSVESSQEKVGCFMFNCRSPSVCTFFKHPSYHGYAALEYEDRKTQHSSKDYGLTKDHKKDYQQVETTTQPPDPPEPTTEAPKTRKFKHWGNVRWFRETTTTTKPTYLKPKYDNSGYDKTTSWVSAKKDWLDDPELDKLSTTHHSNDHQTEDNTRKVDPWHRDEGPRKSTKDYDSGKYGTYDFTQNAEPTEEAKKATESDEDEDFPRRVFVDNNPDFPDEPHYHHKGTTAEKPKEIESKTTKTPQLKITKAPTKAPVTKSAVGNIVVRRLNIQDNKAVIPLAIGLVLALLLLLGVIFRLKTSRRRRTKAFLTDDADYLINGMYL